jgi:hypothetical protein
MKEREPFKKGVILLVRSAVLTYFAVVWTQVTVL